MDIAEWLERLGLGQYASAFAENAVGWDVLPELTADDLKEMGVNAVGDRRRLLQAIAALAGAMTPASTEGPAPSGPVSAAERRQLTVMFCDLVGSTALAAQLDPEDLREIVGAYQRTIGETVDRFAGFIAKYMGDGVLAYFGYPEAHEDDAERAVRAALAVIDAVGRLGVPERLRVRLGIASGLVVVGDLVGEGAAQERGVVGETPNLAARLQAVAAPDCIVIAESTRRQLGALFDVEDLGPQTLAGFAEPQPVWQIVGESGVVSRFEALRSGTTPLVGRDEELDLLRRRWHQAQAGEGRVVLVSGEPGIGKSRLTATMTDAVAVDDASLRLRWFCSPHHQDSALHPFIIQLERAAGFARDDSVEDRLAKLDAVLAPGAPGADEVALLRELMSLPNAATELNLSPQKKREKLFEAMLAQLAALARSRPVLAAFEDAHWVDPTSRELLDLMVDRARRLPVLLVITFRPEFQAGWGGQPHVTTLVLNRLGEREVAAMVLGLAGNAPLGSEVVAEIVQRTDGVPLFVEELTKAVLERGGQDNQVAAVLSGSPLPVLTVPATLHASLIARLDRIGAAVKEVAQVGAVLGREFAYELIAPVAQRSERELRESLDRLTEAGLLFCRGTPPHSSYLFKHALVQDAAYGTLLRTRRQELHARVAAVLEAQFAELVERQPELLAHHLSGAAKTSEAVDQWLKAGRRAATRQNHLEAIGHFERGLQTLAGLPEGPARDRREIQLQLALGLSLFTAKGFQSAAAAEAYARAGELAVQRGDHHQQFMATYGLWQSANGAANIFDCRRLSKRLQELTAGDATDDAMRLEAHHSAWATCLFSGDPAAAREHCEAGTQLYDLERHRLLHQLYGGHDPGLCSIYFGANANWLLGYPAKTLALSSRALRLAERIAHPFSSALALQYIAMVHVERGEPELALQRLEEAEVLAAEQRLSFVVEPRLLRGAIFTAKGEASEAIACLRDGLGAPGATRVRCFGLAWLARALNCLGDHGAALASATEGLNTAHESGHRQWEAELQRLQGIALCGLMSHDEGQAALEQAIATARRQQAKSYELRAVVCLARLWGEAGRRTQARELLTPIYGWFTEGHDTADLKEAAALLDELG